MYTVILNGQLTGEQQVTIYNRDLKYSANTGVVQILEFMLRILTDNHSHGIKNSQPRMEPCKIQYYKSTIWVTIIISPYINCPAYGLIWDFGRQTRKERCITNILVFKRKKETENSVIMNMCLKIQILSCYLYKFNEEQV